MAADDKLGVDSSQSMEAWFVKDTTLSQRISREDRKLFVQICPMRSYHKGDVIFHAGDHASDLHIIDKGQVKLVRPTVNGNERILAICGMNDFIGEPFLSTTDRYRADAVALTDAETCPVSREKFLRLMREAPNFVLTFMEILAVRLFHCQEQLIITEDPVRVRVIKVFIEQARRFGRPLGDGWFELQTELKQEEIASLVTTTRVSVSYTVSELRNRGFLDGTRGTYRLNVPALESLADRS